MDDYSKKCNMAMFVSFILGQAISTLPVHYLFSFQSFSFPIKFIFLTTSFFLQIKTLFLIINYLLAETDS